MANLEDDEIDTRTLGSYARPSQIAYQDEIKAGAKIETGYIHFESITPGSISPVFLAKDALGRDRVNGLKSDAGVGVNPKDRVGATKVDLTLIPTSAKVALALALMDGATKYGPYNWRVEPVQLRTYIGAAERHLEDFKEGEEVARDSLIDHLGHVMACCAIMIDAMSQGTFVDDRPINGKGADIIEHYNEWIKTNKPEGWGR